jgi:hypothetical protein
MQFEHLPRVWTHPEFAPDDVAKHRRALRHMSAVKNPALNLFH